VNTMKEFRRVGLSIVVLMAATEFAGAQTTQLDLASQSKNVDFSKFSSTKPAQVGSTIPSACSVGQIFFDSGAAAGQNLYGCTAANLWSLLGVAGSGGGAGTASQLGDFSATDTAAAVQTIGAGCSVVTPCQIRIGTAAFTMTAPVTATLGGTVATGTVYWYLSSSQVLTAGHNSTATITCSAGCSVATSILSFPPDAVPLWQTTFTANVWDPVTVATMDKRAIYSRDVIAVGSGVLSASNPSTGVLTLTTDPTQVPRYFTGSGAPSSTCTAGRDFYTDTTGLNFWFCDATNTWKQGTDPTIVPRYFTGSGAPSGTCTAGRDFYTDTTGLNLWFCDATNTWKQSTDPTIVPRYFTGTGAPSGSCTAGRDFYTDTTGLNLYFCDAANTWKQANGAGTITITEMHTFQACAGNSGGGSAFPMWDLISGTVSPVLIGGSAGNPCALAFNNSGTAEARFYHVLNPNWSGAVTLAFETESLAGAGVVNTLSVKTSCLTNGSAYIPPSFNAAQTVTLTSVASANNLVTGSISSLTMTGCSGGNTLVVDVTKTDTNATLNVVRASVKDSHS